MTARRVLEALAIGVLVSQQIVYKSTIPRTRQSPPVTKLRKANTPALCSCPLSRVAALQPCSPRPPRLLPLVLLLRDVPPLVLQVNGAPARGEIPVPKDVLPIPDSPPAWSPQHRGVSRWPQRFVGEHKQQRNGGAFRCLVTAFPWPFTVFSQPFLDLFTNSRESHADETQRKAKRETENEYSRWMLTAAHQTGGSRPRPRSSGCSPGLRQHDSSEATAAAREARQLDVAYGGGCGGCGGGGSSGINNYYAYLHLHLRLRRRRRRRRRRESAVVFRARPRSRRRRRPARSSQLQSVCEGSKSAGISPVNAVVRELWKGRSIFSRATENGPENGPVFCECFACTNKYTAKCRSFFGAARARTSTQPGSARLHRAAHTGRHTHARTHTAH